MLGEGGGGWVGHVVLSKLVLIIDRGRYFVFSPSVAHRDESVFIDLYAGVCPGIQDESIVPRPSPDRLSLVFNTSFKARLRSYNINTLVSCVNRCLSWLNTGKHDYT